MIEPVEVYESVRRGYSDLHSLSDEAITDHFAGLDENSVAGHISNIKGILFEQQYVDGLTAQGIHAEVFEATNHPVVDVAIFSGDEVVAELQLKATESVSYINSTLMSNPDVPIVATSEVAKELNNEMVINSGISEQELEESVLDVLLEDTVNPISPLSLISWMFGLPF